MHDLNKYFSNELRNKFIQHYGKVPSCSTIARDFSLLAEDVDPVSLETVRKWLRGDSLPHPKRLRILQAWIGVDLNSSPHENAELENTSKQSQPLSMHALAMASQIENLPPHKKKLLNDFLDLIRKI